MFFWGGNFHRWIYILNKFTKWFVLFQTKWKNTWFFRNTTKWFAKYFWIWPQIGVGFTKLCWFLSKNSEQIYKMVCSFFLGENANSLIQRWLSLTEWFFKFLEIWSYFYKMVCKIIAKQWFWIVLAPPTRPPKFQGGSDAQNTKLDLSTGAK